MPALAALGVAGMALALACVGAPSRRARGSDEHGYRRGCRRVRCPGGFACSNVVNVDLLEQEEHVSLLKGGEGLPHLEVGDHGLELAIEPVKESEDQGPIPDRIAEVAEGCRHRFKTAAEVGDGGRPLFCHAELRRE